MQFKIMKAVISTEEMLNKPGYIYEPKLDGFRALCYVNSHLKFISRNGIDLTEKFFLQNNILKNNNRKSILAKSAVLDGEIIAYDKEGNPSFNALKTGSQAYYIVFDILSKNGKKLITLPLIERKKILEDTIVDGTYIQKNIYTDRGIDLFNEIKKRKGEGVVAKEIDGLYYPGERKSVWLKIKLFNTLDCVIVGYKTGIRLIRSLALGLYDNEKKLHYIGNVGTGFSEKDVQDLYKKVLPLHTDKNPTENKYVQDIVWIKPKLVCEVKYQEFTPYNMLRIAVFMRLRIDKKPIECTFSEQF